MSQKSQAKLRIMVVGQLADHLIASYLTKAFEKQNHEVIRVSVDEIPGPSAESQPPDKRPKHYIKKSQCDHHLLDLIYTKTNSVNECMYYAKGIRQVNISNYTNVYAHIDLLLIIQASPVQYDISSVTNVSVIGYYHTDILDRELPYCEKNFPNIVFYAYVGGEECIKRSHLYEMHHVHKTIFLPYAIDPLVYPEEITTKPLSDRSLFMGFKGSYSSYKGGDPLEETIYDNRRQILLHCKEEYGADLADRTTMKEYIKYMSEVQIGINIPGTLGYVNQRQYEIPLCGCILLQKYYPQLRNMGYISGKNCFMFTEISFDKEKYKHLSEENQDKEKMKTLEYLIPAIKKETQTKEGLSRLQQVVDRGRQLILSQHTYLHRSKQIIQASFVHNERDRGRKQWLEMQRRIEVMTEIDQAILIKHEWDKWIEECKKDQEKFIKEWNSRHASKISK